MFILSFDPGVSTGVCYAEIEVETNKLEVIDARVVLWENRFSIRKLVQASPAQKILVEDYKIFTDKNRKMIVQNLQYARQVYMVTGLIEAAIYDFQGNINNVVYRPSSMQGLKRGAPETIKNPHARSAYYHIRGYLLDARQRKGYIK